MNSIHNPTYPSTPYTFDIEPIFFNFLILIVPQHSCATTIHSSSTSQCGMQASSDGKKWPIFRLDLHGWWQRCSASLAMLHSGPCHKVWKFIFRSDVLGHFRRLLNVWWQGNSYIHIHVQTIQIRTAYTQFRWDTMYKWIFLKHIRSCITSRVFRKTLQDRSANGGENNKRTYTRI